MLIAEYVAQSRHLANKHLLQEWMKPIQESRDIHYLRN